MRPNSTRHYWGNPFPGLRPFDEEDADLFFGRETQVQDLLQRMADERFIAVVGMSGSGKSSLVRAGLIPALRRGKLSGAGVRWRVAVMRPGGDPFGALAVALNDPGALGPSATREATLRASSFGLLHAGKEGRKPEQNLLVVVDQFEEIFRLRDDFVQGWSKAIDFVSALLATSRDFTPEFATYVVLTMRSDYLGDCAQFSGLPEALNRGQYLVPRLAADDWYRALRKPAEQAATPMDEQLLQQLMADAGDTPDQLPVLQHLLMRMWEMRDDARITLEAYKKAGGWLGALNQHLDEILKPLDAAQHEIARRVWQRLTEVGERSRDSRRPARMADLMATTGRSLAEVAAVVEPFRAEGCNFLVSADYPLHEGSIVDISHESLIRRWQTLVGWARQEAESRAAYKEVEAEALSKVPEPWKGAKLEAAIEDQRLGEWTEAWARRYARGDSDEERRASYAKAIRFLGDSQAAEHRRRQRQKWVFRSIAAACVLFLALSALSLYFWRSAVAAQERAERARFDALETQAEALHAKDAALKAKEREEEERGKAERAALASEKAKESADEQRRVAESRALAAEAAGLLSRGNRERALDRAMRAFRESRTDQARTAIARAFPRVSRELSGHTDDVFSAAFSPDARLVVSAGRDKTARLWDVDTGQPLGEFGGHTLPIGAAVFSPDGKWVVTASNDGKARLFDVVTRELLVTLAHDDRIIRGAVFSPDGQTIATISEAKGYLWRVNGQLLAKLPHANQVQSLHFSGDGQRVVTTSWDKTIQVWGTSDGLPLRKIEVGAQVRSASLSEDGRFIVTDRDGDAQIWSAVTGQPITRIKRPGKPIDRVKISPDGQRVLTTGESQAHLWNAATGTMIAGWDSPNDVFMSLSFSPNGRYLAAASNHSAVEIRSAITGRLLTTLETQPDAALTRYQANSLVVGAITSVTFSRDSARVLTFGDGPVRVWNLMAGMLVTVIQDSSTSVASFHDAAFSPDGRRIVTASIPPRVWDVDTGEILLTLGSHMGEQVNTAAFSPDGSLIATSGYDNAARVWNAEDARQVAKLDHRDIVQSAAFSPDSRRIVTASNDRRTQVWTVSGRPIARLGDDDLRATVAAFSPDGRRIVTSSFFNEDAAVFDAASGKQIATIKVGKTRTVAISKDGLRIVTDGADNGVAAIWNLGDGGAVAKLGGHTNRVSSAAYSSDGQRIVTAAYDEARVWNATTGRLMARLAVPSTLGEVRAIFSPDGRYIAGVTPGQVNIYRLVALDEIDALMR